VDADSWWTKGRLSKWSHCVSHPDPYYPPPPEDEEDEEEEEERVS